MSGNLFGRAFRVMTFGESHGPYVGVVIDGVKPGLPIDVTLIQQELDRRRPGQSDVVTPRDEADRVEIISGIFEGKTTGTPLCMLIRNQDQRPRDYTHIQKILRPGHASYTFLQKYGVFDYRGGGRASGRETASRVAAGAVAKQFLNDRGIRIFAYTKQIANIQIEKVDYEVIEKNPVRAADLKVARKMVKAIEEARREGDSLGGVVEIVVKNCPPGLGEPVFNKLEADFAHALMSIGAVKAFEMGSGFQSATMKGSENNDGFLYDEENRRFYTRTNHAGGVLGGISNGQDLLMRITVKPPSSIRKPQETVDLEGKPVMFEMKGRHDPCICPRIVPVAEAMVALVLVDHILMQERLSRSTALKEWRARIDTLDAQLLLLFAQRQHLIEQIATIKQKSGMPITDDSREEEIRINWLSKAKALNLPADLAAELVNLILKYSKRHQQGKTD